MTTLAMLWLPLLLSAVFVFVASSVIHMALPIHKNDYKKLPDEKGTMEALRRLGVRAGQYVFPCAASMQEMGTPEFQAKCKEGPMGTLIVRGAGGVAMGKALLQWFLFCVTVALFVAYVSGLALAPGAGGTMVFRVTTASALLGYGFSDVTSAIWKGVSWSTTARFLCDGLVYALVTGGTFAWLWPAAA